MNIKVLTPCERVIREPIHGPTLIATFQEIRAQLPTELPSNAVVPKEWSIFAVWHLSKDDVGPTYKQWTEILWPDGSQFLKHPLDVAVDKPEWMTTIVEMQGFPLGQTGKLTIRVWIEADAKPVSEVAETWVNVSHERLVAQKEIAVEK